MDREREEGELRGMAVDTVNQETEQEATRPGLRAQLIGHRDALYSKRQITDHKIRLLNIQIDLIDKNPEMVPIFEDLLRIMH